MQRTAKITTAILCTAYLLGCPSLYVPPASPTYTDGVPDSTFYQDRAASTQYLDLVGDVPADAESAAVFCEAQIRELGWTLQPKGADPETQWGRFTTTSANVLPVVLLGTSWPDKTTEQRARTLCHELVHCYQWDDLGDGVFPPTYLLSEGRWSLEVPAYRMSLRVWKDQHPDATIADTEAQARRYATNLFTKYDLNMPRAYAVETAVAIMMEDHR